MKVLVVGGGIIGLATAYELAKAGCEVTVFERATPGAEASSAAAGLLAPLGESSETTFARLALASWRLYPDVVRELQERTGIDLEYVTRGTIYPMSVTQTRGDAEAWAVNKEFGVEVKGSASRGTRSCSPPAPGPRSWSRRSASGSASSRAAAR